MPELLRGRGQPRLAVGPVVPDGRTRPPSRRRARAARRHRRRTSAGPGRPWTGRHRPAGAAPARAEAPRRGRGARGAGHDGRRPRARRPGRATPCAATAAAHRAPCAALADTSAALLGRRRLPRPTRAADLDDLRDRARRRAARPADARACPTPATRSCWSPRDLAPADTAGLDPSRVLALVTAEGGPTSHTAILARALGIPAVVALPRACSALADGTVVRRRGHRRRSTPAHRRGAVADGARRAARTREPRRRPAAARAHRRRPPGGAAGEHRRPPRDLPRPLSRRGRRPVPHRVPLPRPRRRARRSTSRSPRTRRSSPRSPAARSSSARSTPAPTSRCRSSTCADEPNPALGVRGLRIGPRSARTSSTPSSTAIAAAAARHRRRRLGDGADGRRPPPRRPSSPAMPRGQACRTAGVMVEIPAAALRAGRCCARGRLRQHRHQRPGQYTFAADRMCGELADLLDPWQPAAAPPHRRWRRGGPGRANRSASAARRPPTRSSRWSWSASVTSLSMSARGLADVGAVLKSVTVQQCRDLAALAVDAEDATAGRAGVTRRPARPRGARPVT